MVLGIVMLSVRQTISHPATLNGRCGCSYEVDSSPAAASRRVDTGACVSRVTTLTITTWTCWPANTQAGCHIRRRWALRRMVQLMPNNDNMTCV